MILINKKIYIFAENCNVLKLIMKKYGSFIAGICLMLLSAVTARAQYSMGTAGMLNAPSAEMHETGTFVIGGNFLPKSINPFKYNTGNYFVGITLFDFMELTYRETLLKTTYMTEKPKFNQQDRSMSIRIRPLKEGKYHPAIVIGAHDPFNDLGENYYQAVFGAATKHLDWGGHELGLTVGYMGCTGNRNRLNNGVFGGVTYRPAFCKETTLTVEYDTHRVNVGVAARLWRHVSLHAFTSGFDCISGGIRYECVLIH